MKKTLLTLEIITISAVLLLVFYLFNKSLIPLHLKVTYGLILFSINAVFYIYVTIEWLDRVNKIDSNHIRVYLLLIALNIGSITAYKYYDDLKVNANLKTGNSIGIRALGCEVEFKNIKIRYLDLDNYWHELPDSHTYNRDIWKGPLWRNLRAGNITEEPRFEIDERRRAIIVRNSGIVLDQLKINDGLGFKNVQIESIVTLKSIDKGLVSGNKVKNEWYLYSLQFCFDVPIFKNTNKINEFYTALEFFFFDFRESKVRNPELLVDNFSGNMTRHNKSTQKEIMKYILGSSNIKIEVNKSIILNASIINNIATLILKNPDNNFSKQLYRGPIESKQALQQLH